MQPLSRAIKELFGIQYLLCFLVLLLEMSFGQFLCAGTVSELDLGLTAKGASPLTAAEARSAKMAEELDLGIGPNLIPKHGSGGGGSGGRGGRGRGGSASAEAHARAQADLRKHEAAEAADQADTDREMAEAEAMIADAERGMGGRVRTRSSRSTPAIGNQTQNVVPGLHDPAEDRHVGTGTGGSARPRDLRFAPEKNARIHNPAEGTHVGKVPPIAVQRTPGTAWVNRPGKFVTGGTVRIPRTRPDLEREKSRLISEWGRHEDNVSGWIRITSEFGGSAADNVDYPTIEEVNGVPTLVDPGRDARVKKQGAAIFVTGNAPPRTWQEGFVDRNIGHIVQEMQSIIMVKDRLRQVNHALERLRAGTPGPLLDKPVFGVGQLGGSLR